MIVSYTNHHVVVLSWFVVTLSACSCDDSRGGTQRDGGNDATSQQDAELGRDGGRDARINLDGDIVDDASDAAPDARGVDAAKEDGSLADSAVEAGAPDAMIPDVNEACTSSDTFTALTVGADHVCAIRSDGALYCWGTDGHGQLGDGTVGSDRFAAQQVGTQTDWTAIDAGVDFTCGIRGGLLFCWGHDQYGRLGDGAPTNGQVASPSQVGAQEGWSDLSVGSYNACAIREGTTYCWGHGASGRLGDGEEMDRNAPVAVSDTFASVQTGGGHSCGIVSANRRAQCWGSNSDGKLGTGADQPSSSLLPVDVQGTTEWTQLSVGSFASCGIDTGGALYCWGSNGVGQLGIGSRIAQDAPAQVGTDTDWKMVSAGSLHSCGVKMDGSLYCWGANGQGQLGTGGGSSNAPVLVRGLNVSEVDAHGSANSCALSTDGFIYCWGDNDHGQLGLPSADAIRPVRVCP